MEILAYILILNLTAYIYYKNNLFEKKVKSLQDEIEKQRKQIGGIHKRINIEK